MEFIPSDDLNAFGFFDPNEIIRAAHLILVFHHRAPESLLDRGSRRVSEVDGWRCFHIDL